MVDDRNSGANYLTSKEGSASHQLWAQSPYLGDNSAYLTEMWRSKGSGNLAAIIIIINI